MPDPELSRLQTRRKIAGRGFGWLIAAAIVLGFAVVFLVVKYRAY